MLAPPAYVGLLESIPRFASPEVLTTVAPSFFHSCPARYRLAVHCFGSDMAAQYFTNDALSSTKLTDDKRTESWRKSRLQLERFEAFRVGNASNSRGVNRAVAIILTAAHSLPVPLCAHRWTPTRGRGEHRSSRLLLRKVLRGRGGCLPTLLTAICWILGVILTVCKSGCRRTLGI